MGMDAGRIPHWDLNFTDFFDNLTFVGGSHSPVSRCMFHSFVSVSVSVSAQDFEK